jgi:hypothetical protein
MSGCLNCELIDSGHLVALNNENYLLKQQLKLIGSARKSKKQRSPKFLPHRRGSKFMVRQNTSEGEGGLRRRSRRRGRGRSGSRGRSRRRSRSRSRSRSRRRRRRRSRM